MGNITPIKRFKCDADARGKIKSLWADYQDMNTRLANGKFSNATYQSAMSKKKLEYRQAFVQSVENYVEQCGKTSGLKNICKGYLNAPKLGKKVSSVKKVCRNI